jgi:hypothetical protein
VLFFTFESNDGKVDDKIIRDIVKSVDPEGTYYAVLTSLVHGILMFEEIYE